jgi:hypothetical protein
MCDRMRSVEACRASYNISLMPVLLVEGSDDQVVGGSLLAGYASNSAEAATLKFGQNVAKRPLHELRSRIRCEMQRKSGVERDWPAGFG